MELAPKGYETRRWDERKQKTVPMRSKAVTLRDIAEYAKRHNIKLSKEEEKCLEHN